jgi:hypothetical protein
MTDIQGVTGEDVEILLSAMVAIPGVTPALARSTDPAMAGEGRSARFIVDWLVGNGIEARLDEVEPGRPNVVAHLSGPPGSPRVVSGGHLGGRSYLGDRLPASAGIAFGGSGSDRWRAVRLRRDLIYQDRNPDRRVRTG